MTRPPRFLNTILTPNATHSLNFRLGHEVRQIINLLILLLWHIALLGLGIFNNLSRSLLLDLDTLLVVISIAALLLRVTLLLIFVFALQLI